MQRPTVELLLPHSGVRVVLNSYLSISESREVKRVLFDSMKISLADVGGGGKPEVKDMSVGFQIDSQNLAYRFLVQKAFDKEGVEVENPLEYVNNLSQEDGDILFAKIDELSQSSSLSADAKKK